MLLTLRIRDVTPATPRARLVRMGLDGHTFDYAAGQAVLVGNRGSESRRPYSIASGPEDARRDRSLELLVGVRDEDDAGERLTLHAGAELDVEGPIGSFVFPATIAERHVLFIAGGTGIAPLRAMLRHAIAINPPPRVGLLYSARTADDFAFADEFQALAARGALEFRQTVTRDTTPAWAGRRGRIDRNVLERLVHGPDTLCFVCGPTALVDEIPRLLRDMGIPGDRIRMEQW